MEDNIIAEDPQLGAELGIGFRTKFQTSLLSFSHG
jgi:hypothetical protein